MLLHTVNTAPPTLGPQLRPGELGSIQVPCDIRRVVFTRAGYRFNKWKAISQFELVLPADASRNSCALCILLIRRGGLQAIHSLLFSNEAPGKDNS